MSNASLRIPSRRDQEIFHRVVVNCEPQNQIAAELGLTKGRISQIISRVRRWLATGSNLGPGTLDFGPRADAAFSALERQRLERSLAKARHEHLYELALREINRQSQNPKHTTTRTEYKPTADDSLSPVSCPQSPESPTPDSRLPTPSKITTTVRDQPLNVQLLKAAQRSAIELSRLADLEPLPSPKGQALREGEAPAEPQPAEPTDLELFESLYYSLIAVRRQAEAQGRVPKATDVPSLVEHFLCAIAGREHNIGLRPDDAAREVVRRFLLGSLDHETWPGENQILQDFAAELAPRSRCPELTPDNALNNTKPAPTAPNESVLSQSPATIAPTPDPLTTSAPPSSSSHNPKPSPPPPQKNPPPLNPPLNPAPPGSWSFNVLDPVPYDHQEYDRMFHPWSREF